MFDERGCEFGVSEDIVVLIHMEMLPKHIPWNPNVINIFMVPATVMYKQSVTSSYSVNFS
jgi:hypothetical protein